MVAILSALAALVPGDASALTIKEFRKYSPDRQAVFLSGAVSMTAYTHASNNDTAKARCIQSMRLTIPRCGLTAPLGRPVDPEV